MTLKQLLTKNNVIVVFVLLFIALNYVFSKKEGFSSGIYPDEVDYPLLNGDYPLKKTPGLSTTNSEIASKEYPIFSASSFENNNVRYWKTPDNGKCSPATFCNSLYDIKQPPQLGLVKPEPEWGNNRVNYYLSGSNLESDEGN